MNNIELSKVYLPILDEVYKNGLATSILEGDPTLVEKGQNGEIKIAKLDMDALGDFDRNTGYTQGSTKLTWETVKYDKERSQKLKVDRLDNEESLGVVFTKLATEFIRTKVIPETDAARFSKFCSVEGVVKKPEDIADGAGAVQALRTAQVKLDNDEVPTESRILFITSALLNSIIDLDTTKSKAILSEFSTIIKVPQSRFQTAIELNTGESEYGFKKAVGAKDINFMIVEKSAVACATDQYVKYFNPDQDQNGDSHVFPYRNNNLYGHVYENKVAGIYVSHKTA